MLGFIRESRPHENIEIYPALGVLKRYLDENKFLSSPTEEPIRQAIWRAEQEILKDGEISQATQENLNIIVQSLK